MCNCITFIVFLFLSFILIFSTKYSYLSVNSNSCYFYSYFQDQLVVIFSFAETSQCVVVTVAFLLFYFVILFNFFIYQNNNILFECVFVMTQLVVHMGQIEQPWVSVLLIWSVQSVLYLVLLITVIFNFLYCITALLVQQRIQLV